MEHKLKILQEKGVDYTLLTTFTKEFAETPYDTFLRRLKEKIPFTKLVLGFGSRFGKNKEGTEEAMRALSKQLDFHVAYLPKLQLDEQPFSSAHIRTLIATAHFSQIERCLGRPYSVYAPLFCKQEHFHIATSGLCLPPSGTYSVSIAYENQIYPASAHVDRHSEQIHIAFPTPLALPSPCFVELFFDF
jgi:riboflavin kinase/FMN adenylyltransferase